MDVRAADHLDPDGSIVASGERLADVVADRIDAGGASGVTSVSFDGMRGVPPTFFNVLLTRLADRCGLAAVSERVAFRFTSAVQEQVYRRSLAAVARSAA